MAWWVGGGWGVCTSVPTAVGRGGQNTHELVPSGVWIARSIPVPLLSDGTGTVFQLNISVPRVGIYPALQALCRTSRSVLDLLAIEVKVKFLCSIIVTIAIIVVAIICYYVEVVLSPPAPPIVVINLDNLHHLAIPRPLTPVPVVMTVFHSNVAVGLIAPAYALSPSSGGNRARVGWRSGRLAFENPRAGKATLPGHRERPGHRKRVVGSKRCAPAVGWMIELERRGLGGTRGAAVPHRHVAVARTRYVHRAGLVGVELRVEATRTGVVKAVEDGVVPRLALRGWRVCQLAPRFRVEEVLLVIKRFRPFKSQVTTSDLKESDNY